MNFDKHEWATRGSHVQTNADYIRSMTDEELEDFLCKTLKTDCGRCFAKEYCDFGHNGFADWLKQPYKEADDG